MATGITIVAIIINALIALVVFVSNPKKVSNILFTFLVLTIEGWLVTLLFYYSTLALDHLLFVGRLNFFFVELIGPFFAALAYWFPQKNKHFPRWLLGIALTELIFLLLITLFSNLISIEEIANGAERSTVFGVLYPMFLVHFVAFIVGAIILLVRKRKHLNVYQKAQVAYLIGGIGIGGLLGLITNIILPFVFNSYSLQPFGPLATVIFFAFIGIALVRYQLLNIRILAAELFVTIIGIALLVQLVFSETTTQRVVAIFVLVLVLTLGVLLIRSVRREVKQKEILDTLAQQLAASNKQLKRLDEAKTEFLSIASHQLRSPMTGIKGYMSMLVDGDFGTVNTEQKRVMSNVMVNTESLIQLVNLFLDVTRIEEGRFEVEPVKTDLKKMAEETVEQLRPQAMAKHLKLVLTLPPGDLPIVFVDQQKIKQVFVNLIDNAIKYTPNGQVTVSLSADTRPPQPQKGAKTKLDTGEIKGKRVIVCVSDTGIGLDQADIDQLFQKFFRVKGTAQVFTGGSGLGLFVVKKIVELHGGDLSVSSLGKGKGSSFCFSLGVKPVQPKVLKAKK